MLRFLRFRTCGLPRLPPILAQAVLRGPSGKAWSTSIRRTHAPHRFAHRAGSRRSASLCGARGAGTCAPRRSTCHRPHPGESPTPPERHRHTLRSGRRVHRHGELIHDDIIDHSGCAAARLTVTRARATAQFLLSDCLYINSLVIALEGRGYLLRVGSGTATLQDGRRRALPARRDGEDENGKDFDMIDRRTATCPPPAADPRHRRAPRRRPTRSRVTASSGHLLPARR